MANPTENEDISQEECAALGHEFEIVSEGGGGSEFQPPDPRVEQCILCGQRREGTP